MWKNTFGGKGVKGVYVVYRVSGVNLDGLINLAKKRGLTLLDVKKEHAKQLIVTLSYKESKIFFAIAKELCYNIKKVRYKGKCYPLFNMLRALPMFIGALIFITLAFIGADTVLSISFSGSGSVYKRQVESYLAQNGVKPFVRFSSLDLGRLEDKVLSEHKNLSFVSISKQGNKLNVKLVSAVENPQRLNGDVYELKASCDGEIEKIKVYRGTAVVEVGQQVKKGDLLVGGYAVIKEQTVKINLLAYVSMRVKEVYEYRSNSALDHENARAFVLAQAGDKEILHITVQMTAIEKEYIYKVTAYHRIVIYAG